MKKKIQYATLIRDWTYTNRLGETVTFKKGRRFQLNGTTRFDNDGNLQLWHWYGYGQGEIVEKEYFKKK
jgi:hypothetical protein